MRLSRFLPALVVGAVFTATVAPASAATPGVGSTTGVLSVVDLDVGDLLALDVLHDFAGANTDTEVADAGAAAALDALSIVAPALGVDDKVGLLEVQSSGDEDTAANGDIPVSNPAVDGGLLPAALSALLDANGALASITAGIADLDVLGGIVGLDSSQLGIDANALTEQADGSRQLVIDNLTVLDLGDLLAGLGIPLAALDVDTLLGLIDTLGLVDVLLPLLEGLNLPIDLTDLIEGDALDLENLTGLIDGLIGDDGGEGDLCEVLPLPLPGVCEPVGELPLPQIDDVLDPVLDAVLGLLDGTALLELQALDVGMVTTATDSLDTSLAEVTATLGGISVLGVELPEVDVLAAIEQLTTAVDEVLSEIDAALGGLGLLGGLDLLDVGLLEQSTDVAEAGDAIVSEATFTGLRLDVAGLSDEVLSALPAQLAAVADPIGELLGSVPDTPITGLVAGDAPLGAAALADGLSLRIASLGQSSTFTEVLSNTATPVAPVTPEAPELPATGSNDSLMMLIAAVAAAGALGLRRLVRNNM